eukprot:3777229-Amphidinium_carterae.1
MISSCAKVYTTFTHHCLLQKFGRLDVSKHGQLLCSQELQLTDCSILPTSRVCVSADINMRIPEHSFAAHDMGKSCLQSAEPPPPPPNCTGRCNLHSSATTPSQHWRLRRSGFYSKERCKKCTSHFMLVQ